MKNIKLTLLLSVISSVVMAFTTLSRLTVEVPILIPTVTKVTLTPTVIPTAEKIKITIKDHTTFLDAIGHYESSNDYTKVNRFGYMGRYQFGKSTLKAIGINVSKKNFLNDPDLQEEAMQRLMLDNYKSLKRYIRKYDGKVLHGVYVTKSGVLAAAHLGGAGNVRKWFRSGKNFADANGTKITTYMRVFRGYQLDI